MNNKEVMGNMLSVIKTAMVTIIISFTSGVLLDLYKNVAPRIVCKISKCKKSNSNDKNINEYNLTIKNVSKKTIHNLDIHVQSETLCESFKVHDEKITYGLKYDMSEEENIYSINVPFLSKNDEFSAKLLLEDSHNVKNRPIVMLRSPDNFKRVDSLQYKLQNGDNIFSKKVLIAVVSLILIIFSGLIAGNLLNKNTNDIEEPVIETSDEEVINSEEKSPSNETSSSSSNKNTSKTTINSSVDNNSNTNNSTVNENSEEDKDKSSSTNSEGAEKTGTIEESSEEKKTSEKAESSNEVKTEESSSNSNKNSNTDTSANSNLTGSSNSNSDNKVTTNSKDNSSTSNSENN